MLEEQRYGPHIFGEWKHDFFHRYRIHSCPCGAIEIANDPPDSTWSFHAAGYDTLPNVRQCRLNKFETTGKEAIMPEVQEKYGRHLWGNPENPAGCDATFTTCMLCGAVMGGCSGCGHSDPSGGKNPQPDPHLCGYHPLSREELLVLVSQLEAEIEKMEVEIEKIKKEAESFLR